MWIELRFLRLLPSKDQKFVQLCLPNKDPSSISIHKADKNKYVSRYFVCSCDHLAFSHLIQSSTFSEPHIYRMDLATYSPEHADPNSCHCSEPILTHSCMVLQQKFVSNYDCCGIQFILVRSCAFVMILFFVLLKPCLLQPLRETLQK